jgi:hypothetical protein
MPPGVPLQAPCRLVEPVARLPWVDPFKTRSLRAAHIRPSPTLLPRSASHSFRSNSEMCWLLQALCSRRAASSSSAPQLACPLLPLLLSPPPRPPGCPQAAPPPSGASGSAAAGGAAAAAGSGVAGTTSLSGGRAGSRGVAGLCPLADSGRGLGDREGSGVECAGEAASPGAGEMSMGEPTTAPAGPDEGVGRGVSVTTPPKAAVGGDSRSGVATVVSSAGTSAAAATRAAGKLHTASAPHRPRAAPPSPSASAAS